MKYTDEQRIEKIIGTIEKLEKQPLHSRDFSRELGGFFLQILVTYGIISTWIIML